MYNLETSYGPGISFATDDAKPSNHFAQETPSPTILLARTRIAYYSIERHSLVKCPDRPPLFSMSRIAEITIPRSMALHMS